MKTDELVYDKTLKEMLLEYIEELDTFIINANGEEVIAPTYVFNEETEPYFIGQYYQVEYASGGVYYTDLNSNE